MQVTTSTTSPPQLAASCAVLTMAKPPMRKSGFPYFTKPSPRLANPTRRYRNVARLSEITALLEE